MPSTNPGLRGYILPKWLTFAESLRPRSSYRSMLTYHRKYLGFWYIALDTVTNSLSNFSGSSRFISTCTKSFDT